MVTFGYNPDLVREVVPNSGYPHYSGRAAGNWGVSYNVHLHMARCTLWYCKEASRRLDGSTQGYQWVITFADKDSDYWQSIDSAGTYVNGFIAQVDPTDGSTAGAIRNPMLLDAAGVKWYKAANSQKPTDQQSWSGTGFSSTDYASIRVGQYPGTQSPNAGYGAIGWLLATLGPPSGGGTLFLGLKKCDVEECGSGSRMIDSTGTATACVASPKQCESCEAGLMSRGGYLGNAACYWDAPSLTLSVPSFAGDSLASYGVGRSGTYVKAGTHGGLPYYTLEQSDGLSNGFTLRSDTFGGWVLTRKGAMTDGAGYAGDLKMPSACKCTEWGVPPLPQNIIGSPCSGCSTSSEWCQSDGSSCVAITISEPPPPGTSAASTSDADTCTCAASTGGTPGYCSQYAADPVAGKCTYVTPPAAPPPSPPGPPPPLSPPPLSPGYVAVATTVVELQAAGTVDDFDSAKKAAIASKVAAQAGVDPTKVTVTVKAASVIISISIVAANTTDADRVTGVMEAALATTSAASLALGIDNVETVPSVKKQVQLMSAESAAGAAATGGNGGLIAGVVVAVLAAAALVGAGAFFWLRKRPAVAAKVAHVSPPT
jgi:hypothetical protein